MTLENLGLVIDLIHRTGICPSGSETQRILVIDLSGYHFVSIRFCACSQNLFLEPFRQLLRVRWFPASVLRPRTVFTFDLLDTYYKLSLQGKLNLYDFYTTIMQKTDNCGHLKVKVCGFVGISYAMAYIFLQYRYHEMSRCIRQWRHLKNLKWGAAGHTSAKVDELCNGALALEYPACPHPGRNLPPGWENETEDKAYVTLLISHCSTR